jgi:hypothetical protein
LINFGDWRSSCTQATKASRIAADMANLPVLLSQWPQQCGALPIAGAIMPLLGFRATGRRGLSPKVDFRTRSHAHRRPLSGIAKTMHQYCFRSFALWTLSGSWARLRVRSEIILERCLRFQRQQSRRDATASGFAFVPHPCRMRTQHVWAVGRYLHGPTELFVRP